MVAHKPVHAWPLTIITLATYIVIDLEISREPLNEESCSKDNFYIAVS